MGWFPTGASSFSETAATKRFAFPASSSFTSIVVAAELRYGAAKKASPRLTAQLEAVLNGLEILPFEAPADTAYGMIRARLEQGGTPIGGNDLLIAAQAIALGYTVVTDNVGKFARADGLAHENWLR